MTDTIDTERARLVAKQLGFQVDAAVGIRTRFQALGDVLESGGVFHLPYVLAREFIDEVGQVDGNLRLAADVADGADKFPLLEQQLDELEADVGDGIGYTASDEDRRRYYENQTFTGYRGLTSGVDDDGTVSDQEAAGVWVLLGQLPPADAADYWATLPPEERRHIIVNDPDRVAEHVIAAGGELTDDEQQAFADAAASYIAEHGDSDFGAVGDIQPGDEIDFLALTGDALTAAETGAAFVISINGVAVAGHFVNVVEDVAGKAGTVVGGAGVLLECAEGIDGACAGSAAVFVIDAVGTAVLGPVVYNTIKYGAIAAIVLIGLAQEQSPDIQPDWTGSGGAPGVLPYETDAVVDAPTTGRNDGGAGNGQAGRVMADAIGDYCRTNSDEQVCGWGN